MFPVKLKNWNEIKKKLSVICFRLDLTENIETVIEQPSDLVLTCW